MPQPRQKCEALHEELAELLLPHLRLQASGLCTPTPLTLCLPLMSVGSRCRRCRYQFRKETFSGGHDEWDVQFPDSDEDDADFLRSDSLHAHLTRPKARQLHATRGINGEA